MHNTKDSALTSGFLNDTIQAIMLRTKPYCGYQISLEINSTETKHFLSFLILNIDRNVIFERKIAFINNYERSIRLLEKMGNDLLLNLSKIIPLGYVIEDNVRIENVV